MNWIERNKKLTVWMALIILVILSTIAAIIVAYTMEPSDAKTMIISFLTGTLGGSLIGVILKGSGEWLDGKPDQINE